ncbi:molybdopterin-dependent oxidoreductase [Hoeflea olei]|uniref:Biotin transporter BioY n=1 Tax=Hoeflea olei TaxID=1480615 RepID=A0A1C1YRC3_9HYPH|nr:molybdopterin-dependent oxidoreductase [Hoeflea olei]OCW56034.1 biotin transporter BioY [Hoeflea olei]
MTIRQPLYHSSHWGAFSAIQQEDGLAIAPFPGDPDPSPILKNIPAALTHPARLSRPLIRRGWLEDGPGPDARRGSDDYVEMDWEQALELAAGELKRLGAGDPDSPAANHGRHVFGGSYGWSSAGRFHHAQSQVHRFLNMAFGGYVASVDTYSTAAGSVILDTVAGNSGRISREGCWWEHIRETTELVIAFGGLPIRNLSVSPGGSSQHIARDCIAAALKRGCHIVSVSPLRDDIGGADEITRYQPRPATDVAMMIGMAGHLLARDLVDHAYIAKYTSGWEAFRAYLEGTTDGQPKTPDWAEAICGVPASEIRALAEEAARKRTLVTVGYGLQRAENGEQPIWMGLALSAMLGGGSRKGAGFTYAIGSMGNHGKPQLSVPLPTLPQGYNKSGDFIPVARISDLLLNPGADYTYRGKTRRYADIRLVYWAGGNPFHHHQDLSRLRQAFSRPDTVIVHDSVGTATTAHADIIFPATITAERDDIGASAGDPYLMPMQRLAAPFGEARDDYDIFCDLSARLGCREAFSENRSSREWLAHLYGKTEEAMRRRGFDVPDFDGLMQGGPLPLPVSDTPSMMEAFHTDPVAKPLDTETGKILFHSELVASSGLPGHPAWIEPQEWLGGALAQTHPFQLVANQPFGRLHSQLDFGATSMAGKIDGREVARLNDADAARLGIAEGDVIRIFNARGATLAAARPSAEVLPSVVQLSTGAWYAPRDIDGTGLACVNGNPNAVTADRPASPFSQGCAGQICLVSIEKLTGDIPPAVPHEEILRKRGA